ncbi:MAG: hypothetical protein GSR80_000346 [Desulfurococcales archaeon]|nr:hypothetical protein [Desulfurococcales archaeon]
MPTVHLSLPEQVYRKLKERAAELGIQVTDLVKLYINQGLSGSLSPAAREAPQVRALAERVERLERELRVKSMLLEGRYKEMEEYFKYVLERIEMLEDIVEEMRRRTAATVGLEGEA